MAGQGTGSGMADGAGRGGLGLLRVLACGSVDDGKSTLIGRLLHEAARLPDDALAALAADSRRFGTTGDEPDLALLTDGLEAERAQGITIDVAHRYLTTPRRRLILADAPGHVQHTRNMVTGASRADAAIILCDASKGVLTQTRRHAQICALMGIRHLVLAVNKMDLVGFDRAAFEAIRRDWAGFARGLGLADPAAIPVAARHGDNVTRPSPRLAWHDGPTLLAHLEALEAGDAAAGLPFRFPVQWVNRPDAAFRGFAGTVASGRVARGDAVVVAGSGVAARVARILGPDGDLDAAAAGEAVTLCLDAERDIARGDVLAAPAARPAVVDQIAARLVWMDEEPLLPGRRYDARFGTLWTTASVTAIRHRVNVDTLEREPARRLAANEIGFCNLALAQRVPVDPYAANRATGAFVLVDRFTGRTAAAGLVEGALDRASNIHPEAFPVDRQARAKLTGQRPLVVWFTGLSGSGKSTIAKLVEQALHADGRHTYALDGDNLRHGLNRDLGFTDADRVENIRRVGEVAKLFVDAGLIVLCAFISPFRAERRMVREMLGEGEFLEVFVDTPIAACEARDAKGLYAKARRGEIRNFTGVSSPYEPPESPELRLATEGRSPAEAAAEVLALLRARAAS